jgi:amino-acid N-acetyltransferase
MIRMARVSDVKSVQKLINVYAREYRIIPRSLGDLYEHLRDLIVYESEGQVVGVCALHVMWEDLAEIRSLVVDEHWRGKGIGTELISKALEEAVGLGVERVFSLTYIPGYFKRFGFRDIDKSELPHKIWAYCLNCPQFPECDEEAVIKNLTDKDGGSQ